MSELSKRVLEYSKQHPEMSNVELAQMFSVTDRAIRKWKQQDRTRAEQPHKDIAEARLKRTLSDLRKKYDSLLDTLDEKEQALTSYREIKDAVKTVPIVQPKKKKREVVPVIVASDWHIEETVTAAITNGLNEYNMEIAKESIKQFFNNACELIRQAKQHSTVNTVVLAVLGDIINGVLRSEDWENNQTSTIDAMATARAFLYSGVKLMADKTSCNIRVICCVGNHGRLTEKIHYANQVHNNIEYLMYKTQEKDFENDERVSVIVSEAPYIIQDIFGIKVRFHHGHIARYNGGIGGLAVPILRKTAQMNLIERADLDVIGHFHSMQIYHNVIINGSLVGSNAFSMAMGFPYEPPRQTFFLIDSKYGRSLIAPIFIERKQH